MAEVSSFEFPKIHSFIPFYTKQPNSTVFSNQLDSWCEIILDYCEHYKISSISPLNGKILYSQFEDEVETFPSLFENKSINRSVNDDFKALIFKHLIQKEKKAELKDLKAPENGVIIYWKSLAEWSQILYNYVSKTGQLGSILTVYELTKLADSGIPDELKNLEYDLLVKIIRLLVKQGKAQILLDEDGVSIGAVKIV